MYMVLPEPPDAQALLGRREDPHRTTMRADDVTDTLQLALTASGCASAHRSKYCSQSVVFYNEPNTDHGALDGGESTGQQLC
jgi:hypothetical protein